MTDVIDTTEKTGSTAHGRDKHAWRDTIVTGLWRRVRPSQRNCSRRLVVIHPNADEPSVGQDRGYSFF
jgi:hypothetical protein